MDYIYDNYIIIGRILATAFAIYFIYKKDIEAVFFIAAAHLLWGIILPVAILTFMYVYGCAFVSKTKEKRYGMKSTKN